MGLFLIYKGIWGLGGFTQYDCLRKELLVLKAREVLFWLLFIIGINFHTKKLTAHSVFDAAIAKIPPTSSPS